LGECADIFPALWGQWLFRWGRSEVDNAWRLCERLLALAMKSNDTGLTLQAHHAAWATSLGRGKLAEAQTHAEAGLAIYDAKIHRAMASSYGNHDAACCARNFRAISLCLAGDEERARRLIDQSLAAARGLGDPFSLALSLYFASAVMQISNDVTPAAQHAEEGRQIAAEHDLALPRAWNTAVLGWCTAETGDSDRGLTLLTEAIATLQAAQTRHFLTYLLGLLGDAHMKADHPADALKAVQDGIAHAEATGERYYTAELYRLQGELLARPPHREKRSAEASFRAAIKVAREQGAMAFELRANGSLYRLLA
jgi:predicted ATPase